MGEKSTTEQLLREMEAYAASEHVPIINARGREVLVGAVRACRPRRVLEIGTAIGYSALLIAMHAAPDAEITTLELDEERAVRAQEYWYRSIYEGKLHLLQGDAGERLLSLRGKFDFVFIDAAKGQYVDYFHKVLPLLTEHAVIAADNVLFRGYVMSSEPAPRRYRTIVRRLREYIELVSHTPGLETRIYENGDGLAITRRVSYAEET